MPAINCGMPVYDVQNLLSYHGNFQGMLVNKIMVK